MGEYIFGCIATGLVSAVGTHLSHKELKSSVRLAMGLILLLSILAPLFSAVGALDSIELPRWDGSDINSGGEYSECAEEAFCLGISRAIAERYSTDHSYVRVMCDGFDFETMSAKRVYVTLTKEARAVDYRAVKQYVKENINTEECDVEIEIG